MWTLVHPELKTNMNSCSSCSWSTCFNLPILLALGCDEPNSNSEKLAIFEYNENIRTYSKIERPQNAICTEPIRSLAFAPSVGKLYHVLAIASKSLLIATFKTMYFIPLILYCSCIISLIQFIHSFRREPHKYQITTVTLDHDVRLSIF